MSKSDSRKEKAVALRYNPEEDNAPVVIASGYGDIARRIIEIAEQRGIPVFRDDSAASMMCMLEVGNNIPAELYEVVAAIYCQLLQISSEIKNDIRASEEISAQAPARLSRLSPSALRKQREEEEAAKRAAEELRLEAERQAELEAQERELEAQVQAEMERRKAAMSAIRDGGRPSLDIVVEEKDGERRP